MWEPHVKPIIEVVRDVRFSTWSFFDLVRSKKHFMMKIHDRRRSVLQVLGDHKWTIGGTVALGWAGLLAWRALRRLPVRELLIIMEESEARPELEVASVMSGGEGSRLIAVGHAYMLAQRGISRIGLTVLFSQACIQELHGQLSGMFEIQEKQAAARAPSAGSVRDRLRAFKELATASFTRTITAIYVVSLLELFTHVQLFELMKQRRQNTNVHDDAKRRFLTLVQALTHGERSVVAHIAHRVESVVGRFFNSCNVRDEYDTGRLHDVLTKLRGQIEVSESPEYPGEEGQAWICRLIADVIESRQESVGSLQRARAPSYSSFTQETDLQLLQLLGVMKEVVESELFSAAMSAAIDCAFEALERGIVERGFVSPSPAAAGPSDAELGSHCEDSDLALAGPARPRAAAVVSVPMVRLVPVISNLFGAVLSPRLCERDERPEAGARVLRAQECTDLFVAVYAG